MVNLLFALIFAEIVPILILSFKTPLRRLLILLLDRIKRGRGPIVAKTIAGTIVVFLMSRLYSFMEIHNRSLEGVAFNPTDQVLMGQYLLEATLMGFSLFLALMIDRLHHYIRELRLLRKSMKIAQQNQDSNDGKAWATEMTKEEITCLKTNNAELDSESEMETNVKQMEAITALKMKIKQLESECEMKEKETKIAEANSVALRKQLEGFHLEHKHLLEENKHLRKQMKSIDRKLSNSEGKKNE